MVTDGLAPAAIVQPGGAEHGPLGALTSVRPVGVGSVTTTLWASDGPSLFALSVNVTLPPRCADAGPDFVRRKSACGAIAALAVAVLLPGLLSAGIAGAVIVVVSVIGPAGTLAGSKPVTVKMALPPAGNDSVAFTGPIPPDWPQVADALTGVQVQMTPVSAGVVPESATMAESA